MPTASPRDAQRDLVALTTAVHAQDMPALRTVLTPYFEALDPQASAPVAAPLTMFATKLADAYAHIADAEGVTFEQFMQVAGLMSAED